MKNGEAPAVGDFLSNSSTQYKERLGKGVNGLVHSALFSNTTPRLKKFDSDEKIIQKRTSRKKNPFREARGGI